jgi:hypothetical protein
MPLIVALKNVGTFKTRGLTYILFTVKARENVSPIKNTSSTIHTYDYSDSHESEFFFLFFFAFVLISLEPVIIGSRWRLELFCRA